MKQLNNFLIAAIIVFGLYSCEDQEKNPLWEPKVAPYVYIDIENPVFDVTDIENSTFGGDISAPGGTTASYEVSARRVSGGIATDFATVFTTDNFPGSFRITAPEIATALGLDPEELLAGDRFDFEAKSTGIDGTVVTHNNLGVDIAVEPGQRQAYRFSAFIACPFNQAEMIGTYTILEDDGFSATGNTQFEIIAGETTNEIVLVNPYDSAGNFNITVNVNPFGIATFERQDGVLTEEICCAGYSPTNFRSNESTSLALSCIGYLELKFSTGLSLAGGNGTGFTFGNGVLIAQKN